MFYILNKPGKQEQKKKKKKEIQYMNSWQNEVHKRWMCACICKVNEIHTSPLKGVSQLTPPWQKVGEVNEELDN